MKDNNTRRYKLKKDTPESKAGDEYIYTISNGSYAYFKDGNPNSKHWYFVENVENNFEWFEEIKSEPTKEKERLKVEFSENKINTEDFRAQTTANSSGVLVKHWKQFGWQYKVNTGKNPIPEDKFPELKQAIERVINGDIDSGEGKVEPQVMFTTEDGFPVPQGYNGEIWRVFIVPHSYEEWKPYLLGMPQFINSKEEKYFNLKSNAEQYILENKPCLSLNDLLEVWDKHGITFLLRDYKSSGLYKNFEQKAKEKLNK